MSEQKVINACASPFVTVQAWKIPELKADQEITIPSWAISALMHASGNPRGEGYGLLIGRWVVREGQETKIIYDSDFQRKYITYSPLVDGTVRARFAQPKAECQGKDYLTDLSAYLLHLSNLWEGPDGSGTYETETLGKIAAQLHYFANHSEAASVQKIMPFLYLPKTGA